MVNFQNPDSIFALCGFYLTFIRLGSFHYPGSKGILLYIFLVLRETEATEGNADKGNFTDFTLRI